ncbi:putative RING-type zinc-finger/Zinc finger, C3HC4 type (RING finger) containing protein [Leishmania shawi]|uniref:RING-type zinc-finger/Zinc finger, C3HC4 type (RING finger) containing protein n=1 Tax=Leishmania shawi TaxID=5680 RepID=A0AAW3C7A8_9TRYP
MSSWTNAPASSCAAAAPNHLPGTSTSPSATCRRREAAVCPTSGAAPTFLGAVITFGASGCVATPLVAAPGTHCDDHTPTCTAARVAPAPPSGAPSAAAAAGQHDCVSHDFSGPLQRSSPTVLHLYATTTTAAGTANPKRRHGLLPPPIMSDVTRALGHRSCSCPNTRNAPAADAAIASSPVSTNSGVVTRSRAAVAATNSSSTLQVTGNQSSPNDMLTKETVPFPIYSFKPLGLWSALPTTGVTATAAVSASATTLELEASTATTNGVDVGTLLTHEMDSGVVIVDPCQTPDDLVCGVCMSVCRHPTATTCGHLFCRRCLQGWMQANPGAMCPLDRTPIQVELLHTDARAQRQINALPCHCPASLSRASQLELRQLGSAHRVLGDGTAEEGGDVGGTRGDECARQAHPRCTWAGCVSDAAAHMCQCPHIIIECPFAKHGCTVELPRSDMASHLKNCVADHLLLLSQALDASVEQCRALQGEVEVLRQRCPMRYPVALPNVPTGGPTGSSAPTISVSSSLLHGATTATSVPGMDVPTAVPTPALVISNGSSSGAATIAMAALPEEVSMSSVSLLRVAGSFGHGASTAVDYPSPVFSQSLRPYYHLHHRSSTAVEPTNLRRGTATEDMLLAATHRVPNGHDATTPMAMDTTPVRTPSPSRLGASPGSVPVANLAAAAATFVLPPGAATLLPTPVASAPSRAAPVVGGICGVDRFVWVITDVASLQAPCYSRPFSSHNVPWYVGMDTTATWAQCGVYLFADRHEHRVDFRVILYHNDPARDVVHVVRDWQEDYIGKGWGPLRFINRFTLEQDGFLVHGCLRVGIEVLSGLY